MQRNALFSPCGLYRYRLTRIWDERPPLVFVMLNPSRADAETEDPTMRRCIGFARDLGFGGMTALNLFAYRTPHPAALKAAADPVGPDNEAHLERALSGGGTIVAAWGAHGTFGGRARHFLERARRHRTTLSCLGLTAQGHPRHPLYVKAESKLAPFEIGDLS